MCKVPVCLRDPSPVRGYREQRGRGNSRHADGERSRSDPPASVALYGGARRPALGAAAGLNAGLGLGMGLPMLKTDGSGDDRRCGWFNPVLYEVIITNRKRKGTLHRAQGEAATPIHPPQKGFEARREGRTLERDARKSRESRNGRETPPVTVLSQLMARQWDEMWHKLKERWPFQGRLGANSAIARVHCRNTWHMRTHGGRVN